MASSSGRPSLSRRQVFAALHRHQWVGVRGSLGRFHCKSCKAEAICLGCLRGVPAGVDINQLNLHWCAKHVGRRV